MIIDFFCIKHGIVNLMTIKDYPVDVCPYCYDEEQKKKEEAGRLGISEEDGKE